MPRGRAKEPKTLEELKAAIAKLDAEIETHQSEIKALKAKKLKYNKSIAEAEKDVLIDAVKKSGKSISEAIAIITKK